MAVILLFLIAPLAACQSAPSPASFVGGVTMTVYAASSLTGAFGEIANMFQVANTGTRVIINFAGSQALRTQIEQGAKTDVFASADARNMSLLQTQGQVVGVPVIFARNRLVVIAPKSNPAGIKELRDLAKPGLKLDIADGSVPVGNYTLEVLDRLSGNHAYGADFRNQVLARRLEENDVKQVVSKVALGEADAGIVYATDAKATIDKLTTIEIPISSTSSLHIQSQ
jgi:molybdate transport system substrate-binding protein